MDTSISSSKKLFGLVIFIILTLSLLSSNNLFADSGDQTPQLTKSMEALVADQQPATNGPALSNVACVGGMAGVYPCENIDLASHMPLSTFAAGRGNDIWGWTDPVDGTEYALMGLDNGTAFVDISDPMNPVYIGKLDTHTVPSNWRDIKVYADHAYIVAEAGGHGMQVFDLNQLRSVVSPPVAFTNTAHYPGFGSAHNIVINEDTGFAYAVGAGTCSGGLDMIDISNPVAPTFAGCFSPDGYTHDAQCVVYNGPDAAYVGQEICLNSNEDTLTIVDVTNKAAPAQLSRTGYTGSNYTHQGWLTEDHAYFLLNDEGDETSSGVPTRTYIFDVTDLDNAVLIGFHDSSAAAIDHNLYNKDGFSYQANYRAGLRILDLADVANGNLTEFGYFDIFPGSDSASFNGAWSNYPYFDSGVVIVSGIEQGLFVLEPQLEAGFNIAAPAQEINVCVASDQSYELDILSILDFTGNVNLSTTGLPAGAGATFTPNPAAAGSTSTMNLLIGGATAAGSYPITIDGTSPPASPVSVPVTLNVYNGAAATGAMLVSPANGSTLAGTQATLTWTALASASSYTVEIATDMAFTNIVDSASGVTGTTYQSPALDTSSTYYWRVRGDNPCGDGVWSDVYSFNTGEIICIALGDAIPDGDPSGVTIPISLSGVNPAPLTDLNIGIDISHTWIGDLDILLTGPTGASAMLIQRPGNPASTFGCGDNDIDAIADDEGVITPIETYCPGTTPWIGNDDTFVPEQPLATFDGTSLAGDWELFISDNAGQDTGTANEICFIPTFEDPTDVNLTGINGTDTNTTTWLAVGIVSALLFVGVIVTRSRTE